MTTKEILVTRRLWGAPRAGGRLVAVAVALAVAAPITIAGATPAAAAAPAAPSGPLAAAPDVSDPFDVLVFSKTAGFRHGSIPAGIAAIEQLGTEHGFSVDATEDADAFTDENLANYDVVAWLSTTGDVLDDDQQAAFERYIQDGGGYAGIHAASDTEYDWPWYGELVGAYFNSHPQNQDATIDVHDHVHPSTEHLPQRWERFDEWYNFRSDPTDEVHVLASLDESTYDAGTGAMGAEHPIAWCQPYDGGRSWYTGGGHTNESFAEPEFLEHLLGGLQTAAGVVDSDCSATQSDSYETVPLDEDTANPMMLDVADDGTVFYVERDGRVQVIDPESNTTSTAMTLSVTQSNEDGLTGVVLDPDFASNGWIYLFWSPQDVGDDGPHNRVSRFDYDAASGSIDPATEETVLVIPTQRQTCCHAGGDMVFDSEGNLFVATGDNTNPFESQGYSPLDERDGRENFDSQRTSANSNDLRGKILRITPQDEGGYTIPEGNMFAPGTADTLPEIYAMGFRNPFRIGVDPANDNVLVADYGPDAGSANPDRGPAGTVEWNVVSETGFYGWPYCTGANNAYHAYDFATGQSGAEFDCDGGPVNDSPHNTGITQLPPAIEAEVWYGYSTNPLFPEIGGGGAPMGGPVYSYDAELDSDVKWPQYWEGKALFGEWNQGRMYSFQLAGEQRDDLVDINRILPGVFDPSVGFDRPMDFDFGPDGALYVVDWGSGFGGNNDSSGVYQVNYVEGDPAPIARASADVTDGLAPLTVQFSSEGTRHPAGDPITLQWTFGDGSEPSTEANPTHTYTENGRYTAQLTATDASGQTGVANVTVVVGNVAPEVSITFPENGGFFEWGDQVLYEIEVDDPDGEVSCEDVSLFTSLGHDSHAHPFDELTGCSGVIQTARDEGHGIESNIFWVIEAFYTDDGGDAGAPLTTTDLQVLQPKLVQSEFFTATGRADGIGDGAGDPGVQIEETGDTAGGGQNIGYIEPGDYWAHEPVSLTNVDGISLRAASSGSGGEVSVRWDAPDGPEIGSITVPGTGGWQQYVDVGTELSNVPGGSGSLHFVLLSGGINVNWMEIDGRGVTDNERPEVELTVDPVSGDAPLTVTATADATDPDGSGELSYAWDVGLGDGFVEGGEPTLEHTYDAPGTYRLQVRVTDDGGAYAVEYVEVEVTGTTPEPTPCLSGRSDDFLGSELDPERWTVLDRNQDLQVADGVLTIPATATDFYGTNNVTVPNVVLQDLPDGPFTATAKVTIPAYAQYQQAGLVIYGDADNYAKMVVQGRSAPADPATRIFQYIREEAGAPNEVGDSNTAALGAAYPDTVYVRLASSDGDDLTASYSDDGVDFTAMPQTKSLTGIDDPQIGLVALAGAGSAADVVDAQFDWFQITPDDTAEAPGPDDEFDGDSLDACRWDVVREDPTGYRVTGGALEIDTTATDIYTGDNTGTPNIVVQDLPDGDWTVETLVDGSTFDQQYQQGGLIVYGDDDNYVKLDLVTDNAAGDPVTRRIELRSEVDAVVQDPQPNANELTESVWHLRLTKDGSTYSGEYSADGEDWTSFGQSVAHEGLEDARVGLYALGASQQSVATASFDHFRVAGTAEPLEVVGTLDPAEPDGPDGQWLGPVTVTVETTGGPEGAQVYREVDVDGGGWAEYTAPVEISEPGAHTVQVRASADGEEATGETLEFTIAEPDVAEATPAVELTQPTCSLDDDGSTVVSNGAVSGVSMDGVQRYVVWAADDLGTYIGDGSDLPPGDYVVRAWPADGYELVAGEGWTEIFQGRVQTTVTLSEPDCPAAPAVEVVQPTCTYDADDSEVVTGGSLVLADVPGVRSYVVRELVDGSAGDRLTDLEDLSPGEYRIAARPADGYFLVGDGDWRVRDNGLAVLVVTLEEPECPDPNTPDVAVEAATCDAGGSISPVTLPGVRSYTVHRWVDGSADGKVKELDDLAPGDYRVIASPSPRTDLTVTGDWTLSPSGKARLIATVEEVCD
ncbi:ThuA domain-containing protein [Isoptericola chiayiensis]|uniref:ThuA domain-containing protein n=1 Tax=Isoptericola chiayiensis TaxID=579446 RepID=UPI001FE8F3D0|nr:ThuA domain-containing protein [Isoptericola chiayiensis]NOV99136.1 PKD repeat protein/type 1 glutamine amidotransferase [Isoptericola chiayiensis]